MQLCAILLISPPDEEHLSSAAPLVTSALDEEDIIYETDRWVSWGGLIDWEPPPPISPLLLLWSPLLYTRRISSMRQTDKCHEVDWLIGNHITSAAPLVTSAVVDEEDIIYETDGWVSWGGLIDLVPSLACCSCNLCCRRGGYHLWDRQVSVMRWIDWLRTISSLLLLWLPLL